MNKFKPTMIKKILIFSICFCLTETVDPAILSWDANRENESKIFCRNPHGALFD